MPRTAPSPRRCLFTLAVVSALGAPLPAQEPTNENLAATLWVQHAIEYRANCTQAYALAGKRLREALQQPGWTAALEQTEAEAKRLDALGLRAVVLDLDETVLDNSAYQARLIRDGASYDGASWKEWVLEEKAGLVPGAAAFVQAARNAGVHVYYLSNRRHEQLEATRGNVRSLGLPVDEEHATFLLRKKQGDKGARRQFAASQHRLLLLIGDSRGDFSSEFSGKGMREQQTLFTKHAARWGRQWIALPNPNYGSFVDAFRGSGSRLEQLARMRAALDVRRDVEDARPAFRHPLLAGGPMNAWTGMRESCVWVQTRRPARVQLRYWPTGRALDARTTAEIVTREESDQIARFEIEGLESGSRYSYEVYLDGERLRIPWELRFRTKPQWRYRGDAPDLTFTFGSCLYVNDPPVDRPGAPYGGEYETLLAAAREKPDLMLWLGDNCYYRAPDWQSPAGMRRRQRYVRGFEMLQPLLGVTQHYAIWDDHDFGPNNSDRSWMFKDASLDLFAEYWPQPVYGAPGTRGCFYTFEWSDAQFFMLDNRYHRSPNEAPDSPEKRMFGKAQMQWLLDNLRGSQARFKFIVAGNQMVNPLTFYEAFGRYPHEQQELFDFLVRERIGGVLFLSGDRHAGELLRYRHEGAKSDWYEFTSSPLGSGSGRNPREEGNRARVPGTWVTGKRHYGRVRLLGGAERRRVVFSAHGARGEELWRHEVRAEELWRF